MLIQVRIHPNSSQEKIIQKKESSLDLEVWLKEKAIDNKANKALIKILKKYFKKPIKIKKGLTSKNKLIEVGD